MVPYKELKKQLRDLVLAEAATYVIGHYAATPSAKPRQAAFVAIYNARSDGMFSWDPEHQDRYSVEAANWVPAYAVTDAILHRCKLYGCSSEKERTNRKTRQQYGTVEVPMADIVEHIQELCRRATGEVAA